MKKQAARFLLCSLLLTFFVFPPELKAGDNDKENYAPVPFASAMVHYGFIMPSRHTINHLILGHVNSFELGVGWQTRGSKSWHQVYKYPSWGVSAYFSELANSRQLGYAGSIFSHIGFSYYKSRILNIENRLGCGLAYLTKSFSQRDNYKNNAIGSALNAFLQINAGICWNISERSVLRTGLALSHYSNGTFQVPNLGLNIVTANLAYQFYTASKRNTSRKDSLLPAYDKKIRMQLSLGLGRKESYPHGYPKYFVYTSSLSAFKRINLKSRLGAGFDLMYDPSLYRRFLEDNISPASQDYLRVGFRISHELVVTKLSIITDAGLYVFSRWKKDGPVYQRVGLNYPISGQLAANLSLKVHFFKADYGELGVIWKF